MQTGQMITSIIYLLLISISSISCDSRIASSASTTFAADPQGASDSALINVRRLDSSARKPSGELPLLGAAEHMRRANVYMANRAFAEARPHLQAIISSYPTDPNVPAALFALGRSYYQERGYAESLPHFQRLGNSYPDLKEGREGFYFVAPTLLRMGRASEAATRYQEYINRFPQGERIEDAYLNLIDTLREAGKPKDAIPWITRAREKFAGKVSATNALFARLRLDMSIGDWSQAVRTSDELLRLPLVKGVMTNSTEVSYLRAYSLEKAGRKEEAIKAYLSISDGLNSYYGGLATARLEAIGGQLNRSSIETRKSQVRREATVSRSSYPIPYKELLLRHAASRDVDPRFVLAIMRQESNFKPRAKSQAAARGLLQLIPDLALKYTDRLQIKNFQEDDLYYPETSIKIASAYMADLKGMFPGMWEAVAASYNGGEDNVSRWISRAVKGDPGLFTTEVGYAETKDYVFKVMSNYRAYQQLYTEDLKAKN
jgi:soluble lytic murein transglycosylase-like protein/TolA-binding protein